MYIVTLMVPLIRRLMSDEQTVWPYPGKDCSRYNIVFIHLKDIVVALALW